MIERKAYTEEFKREAVALAKQRGSITQTAKELGVSKSCLHIWKNHRDIQSKVNGWQTRSPNY
jgi:transposase-like protein